MVTENNDSADTRELKRVERLVRLEVKLDTLTAKVDELDEKVIKRVENHEARLVKIERIVWLISGIFIVIMVPVTLIMIARLIESLF